MTDTPASARDALRAELRWAAIVGVYGRMRAIASALTEDEIVRLADYYATTAAIR